MDCPWPRWAGRRARRDFTPPLADHAPPTVMPAEQKLIFVSSSADLAEERAAVREVVLQLASLPLNRDDFEPLLWERAMEDGTIAKDAVRDVQQQITPALEAAAVVIVMFGERIGMPLHQEAVLPAGFVIEPPVVHGVTEPGSVPLTGTVFEFLYARQLQKKLLVFVKSPREAFDSRTAAEKVHFGYGHYLHRLVTQAQQAGEPDMSRAQRREYEQQTDWLASFLRHFFLQRAGCDTFETLDQFKSLLRVRLAEQFQLKQDKPGNPFRGLSSYSIHDAAQFFGRKADRDSFLSKIEEHRGPQPLVLLTGRSGTGKSSLLRAGIAADLQSGARASIGKFTTLVVTPAELQAVDPVPIKALAAKIQDAGWECFSGALNLQTWGEIGPPHRVRMLVEAIAHRQQRAGPKLFIAFDQAEEILPQWSSGDRTSPWCELAACLLQLSQSGSGLALIAINDAWRAELIERLSLLCQRTDLLELPVAAPISGQLDEIIKLPFSELGLSLDNRLVTEFQAQVREVAQSDESALPLISLTLYQLYEIWEKGYKAATREEDLKLPSSEPTAAVDAAGGLMRALNDAAKSSDSGRHGSGRTTVLDYDNYKDHINLSGVIGSIAEQALKTLNDNQGLGWRLDLLFPRLFRSLVDMEGGHEALRDADYPVNDPPLRELADELLKCRLLRLSGTAKIRIAHQALLTHWQRARDWLEAERGTLKLLESLRPQAEVWKAKGRPEKFLLSRENQEAMAEYDSAEELFGFWQGDLEWLVKEFIEQSLLQGFSKAIQLRADGIPRLNRAVAGSSLPLVQQYLSLGADPGLKDPDGRTCLTAAGWQSDPRIVVALIEAGADPNAQDSSGFTPLLVASWLNNSAVVEALVKGGAVVDLASVETGFTPLFYAASNNHAATVGVLLDAGAAIDHGINGGLTALMIAALRGQESTIDLLLARGASPDARDQKNNVALMCAAEAGHHAIVRRLLQGGASIDLQGNLGWTALNHAVNMNREAVVRLLLEHRARMDLISTEGITPLMEAAGTGWVVGVTALLDAGAPIDARSARQATALMIAANGGHYSAVETLLARGADVEARDSDDRTALMTSAQRGHEDAVRVLLGGGAKVGTASVTGITALMSAAFGGNEAIVRMLLDAGAAIDARNQDGFRPLTFAAGGGHAAIVRLLLEGGAQIDAPDEEGRTPLMKAAAEGMETTVQTLLDAGASIEASSKSGMTPLMHAAVTGREAITRLMLARGAAIDARNVEGWTALMGAAQSGDEAIVGLLLEAGASIDAQANDLTTALMLAVAGDRESVVRVLLQRHASLAIRFRLGWTTLMLAGWFGHEAVVQALLDAGAGIEERSEDGTTALMTAAAGRRGTTVRLLLQRGADIHAQTSDGVTALMKAAFEGTEATLELLLEAGAAIEARSKDGATPLMYAAQGGKDANVRFLLERGSAVDVSSAGGWTALMRAARYGNAASVKILLDAGAATEARNEIQATPLILAAIGGQAANVQLLLERGADLNARDQNNGSALTFAVRDGHEAVVQMLRERGATDPAVESAR